MVIVKVVHVEFSQFQCTESNTDWMIELKSGKSTLDNNKIFSDDISTGECPFLQKLCIGNQLDIYMLMEILLHLSKNTVVH